MVAYQTLFIAENESVIFGDVRSNRGNRKALQKHPIFWL